MNETDIKKCIKHGYAWSSCGDKPDKTPTKDYTRSQLKTFEGLHATKSEAQLAIAMRSEDAPDNDHAEVKCDMPETLMLNGKLHKRLAEGEPREIGDVPVDGSQTNRFGSVYYRPIAETPESALAKANPAPTEPEHKFPEIPAWCPPLLEGDVPLGFGHAFKGINGEIIKGLHASFTSINGSEEWNIDEIWSGTDSLKFYCSPRTSAVALLNYPWLAEEDKAQMTPITEEQAKMLRDYDTVYHISPANNPIRVYAWPWGSTSPTSEECLENGTLFFTYAAAQAALDKRKAERVDMGIAPNEPGPSVSQQESDGWTKDEIDKAAFKPCEVSDTILGEAARCVSGPRRRDYGTPDENFGHIAALWSVQLKHKVTPMQVAMCLILLKVARQNNSPKRDNLVDIAGYAQCASELTDTAQALVDQAQKLHMGYDEGGK